ncbi:MAG: hypothetical protein PHF60_03055 [Candidatus ainarchaeum sp.]|nr:hypothetical protein [Candidatus ainarchaeum sp.]
MAGAKQKPKERPDALAIAKGFRGYGPEKESGLRETVVKEDEMLRQLKTVWETCNYKGEVHTDYAAMCEAVKELGYSAKDVERFSIVLVEFQDEHNFYYKAGVFLSALVNSCREDDLIIHTSHLTRHIDHLGYQNMKNITIEGDAGNIMGGLGRGSIILNGNAGNYAGLNLLGGSIIVKGNVGEHVGNDMKSGSITVKGNAGDSMAGNMRGGIITVEGNAGKSVGWEMTDGEIHLNGDYGGVSDYIVHGKIFHKGKLIFGK